jgi:hypothetical protein
MKNDQGDRGTRESGGSTRLLTFSLSVFPGHQIAELPSCPLTQLPDCLVAESPLRPCGALFFSSTIEPINDSTTRLVPPIPCSPDLPRRSYSAAA